MREYTINDVTWTFIRLSDDCLYQLWVADYWCPDGDGIELHIAVDHFELSCFSGIGASTIKIHDVDFIHLKDKVSELDFTEPFELQVIKIADYLCRMFCNY